MINLFPIRSGQRRQLVVGEEGVLGEEVRGHPWFDLSN